MNYATPKARARLLLCLDGFGPVTIEAAILGCDAPAGRHGTVTK